jgi:UDP-GlcNAc:undecaprenyl-phosphate/decaprenyl-phosphate GlcNAc-1-phosphate transferase
MVIPQLVKNVLILVLAFLLSMRGTRIAQKAASHFGIMDKPDGNLKIQTKPVPYLGGLSIYICFLITLSLFFEFDQRLLGLLLGGSLVMILGLLDDLKAIEPYIKILGQLLAVLVLIKSGIHIDIVFLTGWQNDALTVLWVLTLTNALNIIDIMDGLAGGISGIAMMFLAIIAYRNGNYFIAEVSCALLGVTAGFLWYNYNPASIYLGDCGSLFLGFMLASLSMIASYATTSRLALLSPLVLFSIPLFDLAYVIVLRLFKRKSPFRGSKDHFAVRMRIKGMSVRTITNFSYSICFVLGIATVANTMLSALYSLILYGIIIVFFFIFGGILSRVRVD